jgi:RNA polymerase sigma-70 factor (ECF subfamily)
MNEAESLRRTAFAVAYRITGQPADAEDIAQDCIEKWLVSGGKAIASPTAFVATMSARLSLNQLRNRRRRRDALAAYALPVPAMLEQSGDADARLDIGYGMVVLTQSLPPLARAVFVLRQGFELSYHDIAEALDRTRETCRQAHSRARKMLAASAPAQQASPSPLLIRLVAAISAGDLDRLTELLAADVILHSDGGGRAPALGRPIDGRERIAQFLLASRSLIPAEAQPHVVPSASGPVLLIETSSGLEIVVIAEGMPAISRLYVISDPDKLARIGH